MTREKKGTGREREKGKGAKDKRILKENKSSIQRRCIQRQACERMRNITYEIERYRTSPRTRLGDRIYVCERYRLR